MKTIKRILLAGLVAIVATSCTSAFYTSSGSAYDDLYAVHDRTAIANRQKAEADARRQGANTSNTTTTSSPKSEKRVSDKVGDYVDFEEVE